MLPKPRVTASKEAQDAVHFDSGGRAGSQYAQAVVSVQHEELSNGKDGGTVTVDVEEIRAFAPSVPAQSVYFNNQVRHYNRRVKLTLANADVMLESGALNYMIGDIHVKSKLSDKGDEKSGVMSIIGKTMKSAVTGETLVRPRYIGTGEIYLETTRQYPHCLHLKGGADKIVVDAGSFLAASASVKVGAQRPAGVAGAVFSGESIFQTSLEGEGFVVVLLPCPPPALHVIHLGPGETVKVDGSAACLRRGPIKYSVEKITKGYFSSGVSGEGYVNVFHAEGKAEIWVDVTAQKPQPVVISH